MPQADGFGYRGHRDVEQVLAPERKQEMDVLFRQGRAIRTDGCEDKTPREGDRYEKSLHRHGILPKQAKEQEV